MPTGAGDYDVNGIWLYGEDDLVADLWSDYLNIGLQSVSDALGDVTDRIDTLEDHDGAWTNVAFTTANLNVGSTGVVSFARTRRSRGRIEFEWGVTLGGTGISVGDVTLTIPGTTTYPITTATQQEVARGQAYDSSVGSNGRYELAAIVASTTQIALRCFLVGTTYIRQNVIGTAVPFTWAAGDQIVVKGAVAI